MITCHNCGHTLNYFGQICPKCGSRLICIEELIPVTDSIQKLKKKNKNIFVSESKKDVYEEYADKWEVFRKTGKLQHTIRIIDRLNDQYFEHIETPEGENIIHIEESLHEHEGHGSAKKN